ncbi:MAG: threonylcarbamoyl-AMP synthase [Rickettsiales bacterium]|nr:threonylcarbamoyl-AMP synthase [Rickettsiales bacterium]
MERNILKESCYSINKAVQILNNNGIVALKAETVYGIACNANSIFSIESVYNLKKRPFFNPLIIHVSTLEMACKIAVFNNLSKKIAKHFWPGPLTLILPRKKNKLVEDFAVSGLETIALRIPNSTVFQKILKKFKKPIAAPSANPSGYISSTKAKHVFDSFGKKIELIIDSGKSHFGLESTILDLSKKKILIARQGIITPEVIKKITGINIEISDNLKKKQKPISPGQIKRHYAPNTPLIMNVKKPKKGDALLFFGNYHNYTFNPSLNLSKKGDLYEAAQNLFDYLRKLDKLKMKRIAVTPIPQKGIGKTINERLRRASVNG